MSTASWFWDRVAGRYARMPIIDPSAYETKLNMTRRYFPPAARVLEFGCGTGSTALAHAPHVAHIHGIDSSAAMIDIARAKQADAGIDNLSFEHTTLEALDSAEAHWDVIMGMNILHLLDDRPATIRRVHALLKPGGVFVSSTVCFGDAPLRFRLIASALRWLPRLPTIAPLRLAQLEDELRRAGFMIEACWRPRADRGAFIVARR